MGNGFIDSSASYFASEQVHNQSNGLHWFRIQNTTEKTDSEKTMVLPLVATIELNPKTIGVKILKTIRIFWGWLMRWFLINRLN